MWATLRRGDLGEDWPGQPRGHRPMRSSSRRTRSSLTRRKPDAQDQDRDCCDAEGLMRVLVALGGNALQKRGEPMTVANQRANVAAACAALAPVALEHELVISHGNGPQVGLLALQASAFDEVSPYPFDVLGAQTEGMIGYLIEQELGTCSRSRSRSPRSSP